MLKEVSRIDVKQNPKTVLILILMEHAQRVVEDEGVIHHGIQVLILILMEHAQRD